MPPFFTLIRGASVYTPAPRGEASILLAGSTILKIGEISAAAVKALPAPCEEIDASGCFAVPGFVDSHNHIAGAGGEQGFASRMPAIDVRDLALAGVTTVIGVLGTDTTTRHLPDLLAKARQLEAQGLTAYVYTGGYPVPTPTFTGSVQGDLVLIDKVIGVGELAIADVRSLEPPVQELAKLVSEALVGGSLAGKAGIAHFHVGPGKAHLTCLHRLLDEHQVDPEHVYPIHVNRNRALMEDAIALANLGTWAGMDTVDEQLPFWLRTYCELDGPADQVIVASDAQISGGSVDQLYRGIVDTVRQGAFGLEDVLPFVTTNPARALKLASKGRLEEGADADVLLIDKATLAVAHVVARGRALVRDGRFVEEISE